MKITNNTGISLPLAVWLLSNDYDYIDEENYISATTLMRPIRAVVLANRVPPEQRELDIGDLTAARMGTALHDSIEKAWLKGAHHKLRLLGHPESVIKRVLINPTEEELAAVKDPIPIYLEQREKRKVGKWTVGGKFDMVAEGVVQDNKSTSAFSWLYGSKDDDYILQLSIYKWLNPKKITEDYGIINFIFTDWNKQTAAQNPKYPQKRLESKPLNLLSHEQVDNWVKGRLTALERYWDAPEGELPECTDEELWRSAPKYKYYANPEKTSGRSTKNFEDMVSARRYQAEKGGVGVIITVPGEPKRCGYCPAFTVCSQKDKYFTND